MEYPSEFKRVRWDGAVVHVDNLDPRHPLDFLPTPRDNPVIQDPQKEGVLNIPEEFDYAIFALIDGDGNPIVDDEGVQFRVPQTAASF
jgi:hypothetical protein